MQKPMSRHLFPLAPWCLLLSLFALAVSGRYLYSSWNRYLRL